MFYSDFYGTFKPNSLKHSSRAVARSENPVRALSTVVGIICPPGGNRVNCSNKNWETHAPRPPLLATALFVYVVNPE